MPTHNDNEIIWWTWQEVFPKSEKVLVRGGGGEAKLQGVEKWRVSKKLEPEYTLLFKDVSLCIKFLLGCEVKLKTVGAGFPGGAAVENLPANAGDTGSSPGLGRSHMPRSN